MTDGPEAEVGEILDVRFPRPRERKAVMEHPDYYVLREQLIEFLEVRAHRNKKPASIPPASPPSANSLHSDSEIRTEPETETVNA